MDADGTEPGPAAWLQLVEQLSRCSRTTRRALQRQLGDELSESQYALLRLCANDNYDAASQLDIATRLALSPAQVSGMVEQLRKRGLVIGQRSKSDRRRQVWKLTSAGRNLLQRVEDELASWSASVLGCLEARELRELTVLLNNIEIAVGAADKSSRAAGQVWRDRRPAA